MYMMYLITLDPDSPPVLGTLIPLRFYTYVVCNALWHRVKRHVWLLVQHPTVTGAMGRGSMFLEVGCKRIFTTRPPEIRRQHYTTRDYHISTIFHCHASRCGQLHMQLSTSLAVLFEKSSGGLRKPPKALNATRNTQQQAAAMSEKRNGRPGVQWQSWCCWQLIQV